MLVRSPILIGAVILGLFLVPPFWSPAQASTTRALEVGLNNGIRATIFPADYLATKTVRNGTRGVIHVDDNFYLTVVTDVADPLIVNKGDGSFHPYSTTQVIELLEEIRFPGLRLSIEVFILPFPRSDVLVSSTLGGQMFLSPQVREISRESAAYVVAHELGHVFQWRYLPTQAIRQWLAYRHVRGIEDSNVYHARASHAYRPVEIFAEDFRVLYGGPSAFFGGQVENPLITPPLAVAGLDAFLDRLTPLDAGRQHIVAVNNYPNPFNPRTRLRAQLTQAFLDTGERLHIRVYDVRGALVRELFSASPGDLEVEVEWDGRDGQGRGVASSTYFGVFEAGDSRVSQKLLMIK